MAYNVQVAPAQTLPNATAAYNALSEITSKDRRARARLEGHVPTGSLLAAAFRRRPGRGCPAGVHDPRCPPGVHDHPIRRPRARREHDRDNRQPADRQHRLGTLVSGHRRGDHGDEERFRDGGSLRPDHDVRLTRPPGREHGAQHVVHDAGHRGRWGLDHAARLALRLQRQRSARRNERCARLRREHAVRRPRPARGRGLLSVRGLPARILGRELRDGRGPRGVLQVRRPGDDLHSCRLLSRPPDRYLRSRAEHAAAARRARAGHRDRSAARRSAQLRRDCRRLFVARLRAAVRVRRSEPRRHGDYRGRRSGPRGRGVHDDDRVHGPRRRERGADAVQRRSTPR